MTSDSPKPKRRWLQFSLRTFFILLTAFAVWFGWAMNKAREQKKAVAWVEEMGGWVLYEYEVDDERQFISNAEPPGLDWLTNSLGVDFFQDVVQVDLIGTQVNDLTPLAGLKNLQVLDFDGTQVSDLTPLAGLKNLQCVGLNGTQVNDLRPLAGLNHLQVLDLDGTQVNDLTPLAGLRNLQFVDLDRTQVNDLTPLVGLHLQGLGLDRTPVSKEQIEALKRALPNCEIYGAPQIQE